MYKIFESPRGAFRLGRHEEGDHPSLQAWDAADEYLLSWLAEENPSLRGGILLVNDSFGALSAALNEFQPSLMTDSLQTRRTVARNLAANGIPENRVSFLTPFERPAESFSLCLVKIPKSLSLLETELAGVRRFLAAGAVVAAAGMSRDIHSSTVKIFEEFMGPARTSLARKKARLIFGSAPAGAENGGAADTENDVAADPVTQTPRILFDAATGFRFALFGGVFSQGGIDVGTRLLVTNLPAGNFERVIDLGCGSGVLGLAAAKKYPAARVSLADESFLAVESARETFRINGMEERGRFVWGNRLENFPEESADLILCNPPFHENRAVSLSSAAEMFRDARRVLRKGGELRLVANVHLGYGPILGKYFTDCAAIVKNAKFVLYSCS